MGRFQYFLGIKFTPKGEIGGYVLPQHQYILDMLQRTNMSQYKSTPTPMTSTMKLNASDDVPFTDKLLYRSMVGAL